MHPEIYHPPSILTVVRPALPSVVIVLPFEPKMRTKAELEPVLAAALSKAEKDLMLKYPSGVAMPVIRRVQAIFRNLNYATHKRSIAIFASAETEKVLYLDLEVEEKVVTDGSFGMQDLVDCKKNAVEYLVMILSARQSKMYTGNGHALKLIKSNAPQNVYAYLHEPPERVANFSDPEERRELMLDKFLHHMDEGLSAILKAYPLPVFLVGSERVLGHFWAITRHAGNIAGRIYRNCGEGEESGLQEVLEPYIRDWRTVRQQNALRQVEMAEGSRKLSHGLQEVAVTAKYRNSSLLVVERGFSAGEPAGVGGGIQADMQGGGEFYIKSPVDRIVQKVLENGGEVEWVDKGLLKDYGGIALVRYY